MDRIERFCQGIARATQAQIQPGALRNPMFDQSGLRRGVAVTRLLFGGDVAPGEGE